MIVPEIIIAIAIFYAFASVHLVGHVIGLIVAQTALGVPFVVINVSAALYGVDERLERAAQVLGASPLRAFWSITLPLIRPGVLAGALPLRTWQGLREQIDPTVSAVSTLLIVTSTILLLSAEFLRRRQERLRTRPVDAASPTIAGGTTAAK
jgi:putative spermidine/putrescine transport system permease protein